MGYFPPFRSLAAVLLFADNVDVVQRVLGAAFTSPWVRTVVAVDDASEDGTAENLDTAMVCLPSGSSPTFRVIRNNIRVGKGAALAVAAATLRPSDGEFVAVHDADFPYVPVDHAAFVGPLLHGGADIVYGSRFETGGYIEDCGVGSYLRGRFVNAAVNAFAKTGVSDVSTGYRVMRREVMETLRITEAGAGVFTEMTIRAAKDGWRTYEVGVRHNERSSPGAPLSASHTGVLGACWRAARYSLLHDRPATQSP